jgi:hypothetical protein
MSRRDAFGIRCSTGFQPVPCVLARNRVSESCWKMFRWRDCVPDYRHDTGWKPVLRGGPEALCTLGSCEPVQ